MKWSPVKTEWTGPVKEFILSGGSSDKSWAIRIVYNFTFVFIILFLKIEGLGWFWVDFLKICLNKSWAQHELQVYCWLLFSILKNAHKVLIVKFLENTE